MRDRPSTSTRLLKASKPRVPTGPPPPLPISATAENVNETMASSDSPPGDAKTDDVEEKGEFVPCIENACIKFANVVENVNQLFTDESSFKREECKECDGQGIFTTLTDLSRLIVEGQVNSKVCSTSKGFPGPQEPWNCRACDGSGKKPHSYKASAENAYEGIKHALDITDRQAHWAHTAHEDINETAVDFLSMMYILGEDIGEIIDEIKELINSSSDEHFVAALQNAKALVTTGKLDKNYTSNNQLLTADILALHSLLTQFQMTHHLGSFTAKDGKNAEEKREEYINALYHIIKSHEKYIIRSTAE